MAENINKQRIAVIGSGSWATALAKMLMHNVEEFNWYFRSEDNIKLFKKYKHNPKYLRAVEFDTDRINFYSDINKIAENSDILIFVVPSAFLKVKHSRSDFKERFKNFKPSGLQDKVFIMIKMKSKG